MIRKIKVDVTPAERVHALGALLETRNRGGWPDRWYEVELRAGQMLADVAEEYAKLVRDADELAEWEGVTLDRGDYEFPGEYIDLGTLSLEVDLRAVMSDPEAGIEVVRKLHAWMKFADEGLGFDLSIRMGVRRGTALDAEQELEELAQAYGTALDPAEVPDVDFGGEDEGEGGEDEGEGGEDDVDADEDDVEDEGESEDDEASARRSRPPSGRGRAAVKGRFKNSGGAFGGLDENAVPPRGGTPRPGGPTFLEGEMFFLAQTQVQWPSDAVALRRAWKLVVLHRHPDRAPDDPHAHGNFVMLKAGYEALLRRLGVEP